MRRDSSIIWFLLSFTIIAFLSSLFQTGCADLGNYHEPLVAEHSSSDQGGTVPIIQMPFASGMSSQCVQGASGSFSHNAVSTKYDIDFDTSNTRKEELFSPVSGVAYVHTEDASKNFGNHLCIDLGNGTYVILGHMSDVLVQNGQQVAAGQLLGHEGCTGYCSGDHVHIGLHKGDAKQMGQFGISVPMNYLLGDKTLGSAPKAVSSTSLVCGLKALGDTVEGHFYTSTLLAALWHPEGTLIKSPTSPKVYVVKYGNLLSWIENEKAFVSRGYDFKHVVTVSEDELPCYDPGANISGAGYTDVLYDGLNQLWLFTGAKDAPDRSRRLVSSTARELVLASWGLPYSEQAPPHYVTQESMLLDNWPIAPGYATFRDGTLVREASRSDVFVITGGVAVPIVNWDTFLLLGYHSNQILMIPDGSLSVIQNAVGNCSASLWCLEKNMTTSCGGNGFYVGGTSSNSRDVPISISSYKEPDAGSTSSPPTNQPDAGSSEPDAGSSSAADSKNTPPPAPKPTSSKDDVWLNDYGLDGAQETLMIRDDRWLNASLVGKDAYVYGVGGCFDNNLNESDRVTSSNGYYHVDFSKFDNSCIGELTLVSTIGTDGNPPNASMTNWYWWQDAPFCYGGSMICQLEKNNTSWEEWLLRVSWNSIGGLQSAGNGFTKNSQLK